MLPVWLLLGGGRHACCLEALYDLLGYLSDEGRIDAAGSFGLVEGGVDGIADGPGPATESRLGLIGSEGALPVVGGSVELIRCVATVAAVELLGRRWGRCGRGEGGVFWMLVVGIVGHRSVRSADCGRFRGKFSLAWC